MIFAKMPDTRALSWEKKRRLIEVPIGNGRNMNRQISNDITTGGADQQQYKRYAKSGKRVTSKGEAFIQIDRDPCPHPPLPRVQVP